MDVANGGGCMWSGVGSAWGLCVLGSQFCCECKTVLKKIKSIKNMEAMSYA